jgi:hypothetical protein
VVDAGTGQNGITRDGRGVAGEKATLGRGGVDGPGDGLSEEAEDAGWDGANRRDSDWFETEAT